MAYPYPASYMMGPSHHFGGPPSPQPSYANDPYHASRLGSRNPSPQPMVSSPHAHAHSHSHSHTATSPITSPTSPGAAHSTSSFMPQYGTAYGSAGPASGYGGAAGYGAQPAMGGGGGGEKGGAGGGASPYMGYGVPLGGGGSPYGSSSSSHGHHNASYGASPIGAGGYGQPQGGNSPSGYPSASHSPYGGGGGGHAHTNSIPAGGGSPYGGAHSNQGAGSGKLSGGGSPYGGYPSSGAYNKDPSPYRAPVYLPGASPDPYAHAHRAPPAATYATSPATSPTQAPSPYGHAHPHAVPSPARSQTTHSHHGHTPTPSRSASQSYGHGHGHGHSHSLSGSHSPHPTHSYGHAPPAPLAPPSPRMAYPSEPPSPRFSTDPSDAPNLLHPLVAYNDRVTPVDWNMRTAPSTHLRIPSTIQSSELVLAATAPAARYIRLVSPLMPWFIPIEHPATVSVMHVFEAVYAELQKPITQAEWRIAPERQREKVTEAYTERCAAYDDPDHERSLGIKRIDWLAKNTRFGGLRKDEDAAALKDSLTPYTFTLVCTTR